MKYLCALILPLAFASTLACGEITPQHWESTAAAASRYSLEPELLAALVWQESRYCEGAVSPAGAIGLGQLMPTTAQELGVNPWQTGENLEGAARYLRTQLDTFGTVELALAAYNAGPGAVERHAGLPPYGETQAYVPAVLAFYEDFKRQRSVVKVTPPAPLAEGAAPFLIYQRGDSAVATESPLLLYSKAVQIAATPAGDALVLYRRGD